MVALESLFPVLYSTSKNPRRLSIALYLNKYEKFSFLRVQLMEVNQWFAETTIIITVAVSQFCDNCNSVTLLFDS